MKLPDAGRVIGVDPVVCLFSEGDFFGADSHWFAPSSGRAISGILAGWQMVKSLMLEVRRE